MEGFLVSVDNSKRQANSERKSGHSKAIGKRISAVVVTTLVHVGGFWKSDSIVFCFDGIGFCAYFCCPCFCCQVYNRADEWMCTPYFCCWPDSLMSLRMKIRTGFRLQVRSSSFSSIFSISLHRVRSGRTG